MTAEPTPPTSRKTPIDRIRAAGVPMWVTVFVALMGTAGLVVGLAALVDPSLFPFTEADEALGQRWAGRMIGLGIVTTGAVILRSRPIYVLALLAGIAREVGDLVGALTDNDTTAPAIGVMLIGIAALAHIARTPTTQPSDSGPET